MTVSLTTTALDRWAGVARMGGVGDNLMAASVLRPLKRAGYRVEVISQEPQCAVFHNNPHVDRLVVKRREDFPTDMLAWQQWFDGRGREYALFANLSHSCENALALFPASTPFYWPAAFRRRLCGRSYLEFVHDILGMPYDFGPLFFPTDAERAAAAATRAEMRAPVVGWCLSGTRIDKVYPYAPMAVARIIRDLGASVMMFGAPGKDFGMAKAIEEHVGRQNGSTEGLHLALSPDEARPTWPIRRILTQAAACDVVVGPDTGPMWGVAFEPVYKVMLLSHASEENITKHWVNTVTLHADPSRVPCWPCHRLHDTPATCVPNRENNGSACVSDVSVEDVVRAVDAGLRPQTARGIVIADAIIVREELAPCPTLPPTPRRRCSTGSSGVPRPRGRRSGT